MNKAKINELYEKAYVTYEVPYESSVVDPTIVSIHKQRVWDRHLFAELIVKECAENLEMHSTCFDGDVGRGVKIAARLTKEHFGVEE